MTQDNSDDDSSTVPAETGVEAVIRAFHQPDPPETASFASEVIVQSMLAGAIDPGDRVEPSPVVELEPVLRDQLTENTGRHPMDSGRHYGRSWEQNQDNPPWEQPEWDVSMDYVAHNVYHYMRRSLGRDRVAVALEEALYAFGNRPDRERESWLQSMEDFAEASANGRHYVGDLVDLGLHRESAEVVVGHAHECSDKPPLTHNTYNSEYHTLSQCLQFVTLGGPYSEYVAVQVHGGADIRGGYTAPRVYRQDSPIHTSELQFECTDCDWRESESCLYDSDEILYQRTVDQPALERELVERLPDDATDDEIISRATEVTDDATDDESVDGGVFHLGGGCGGRVTFF